MRSIANNQIYPSNLKGFTMVEVSIVIVIIGLAATAITSGKGLIRNSQLRSVITDINNYSVAIRAFKEQYDYYPGDLPTAFNYWGTNCAATAGACNGNGDRLIGGWTTEGVRAWRHLTLAGLLNGMYTGTYSGTVLVVTDVPASKITNAGYHFPGNYIEIGSRRIGDRPCTNILSAPEAYAMDSKADNGLATSGWIRGDVRGYLTAITGPWSAATCCGSDSCAGLTSYVLTNTATNSCRLGFNFQ